MSMHTGTLTGAPIELKDALDADPAEVVTKALEGLEASVSDRLKAIETKAAENVRAAARRLEAIETRLSRPGTPALETKAADLSKTAFLNFIRNGLERMGAEEQKALTLGSSAAGGYLAPPEFGSELLKLTVLHSPIRKYARVVTANGNVLKYPRRISSLSASWVDETSPRPESEPSFEQVSITPFELATQVPFSNQLLEDQTYNLEGELYEEFAEQFGVAEGAAFLNGSGIGQPKGLLNAAGIQTLKTGNPAGFPTDHPVNALIDMFSSIPAVHAANGVWLAHPTTVALMRQWVDGIGRSYLVDPIAAAAPTTILGRPLVQCIDMPVVGAGNTILMFGDLQGYRIVDRVQPQFLRDPYTMGGTGQTLIRGRKRVGGDVTHPDRFVKLIAAA